MGRSRYTIYDQQAPHFLTCTINNWIPIFTRPATVQVILDALTYRQAQRGLKIYAFVILENHLHLIAQSPDLPAEISSSLVPTRRVGTRNGRASVPFSETRAIKTGSRRQ